MKSIVVIAILIGGSAQASATTFKSYALTSMLQARTPTSGDSTVEALSGFAPPGDRSVLARVDASDTRYSLISNAGVATAWSLADSGTVDMRWGWSVANFGNPLGASIGLISQWQYKFTASGAGRFVGRYAQTATLGELGSPTLAYSLLLTDGPRRWLQTGPYGTGAVYVPLVAGADYRIAFRSEARLTSDTGFTSRGRVDTLFDWSIIYGAVPEPATWAMLIVGFGFVGAAARAERGRTAAI